MYMEKKNVVNFKCQNLFFPLLTVLIQWLYQLTEQLQLTALNSFGPRRIRQNLHCTSHKVKNVYGKLQSECYEEKELDLRKRELPKMQ